MNEKIEIKYNNKTYEIEKDAKEQKVRPKGTAFTEGDQETDENKAITVKNYQENFWNTSVEVNGAKIELEWGKGKYLTIYGTPATIILGAIAYFFYFRKKTENFVDELENKKDQELDEI